MSRVWPKVALGVEAAALPEMAANRSSVVLPAANQSETSPLGGRPGSWTIRTRVAEIRETKDRGAAGVRVMSLEENERVVAFEVLAEAEGEAGAMAGDGEAPSGSTPPSVGDA